MKSKKKAVALILLCTLLFAGCFDEILYESKTTGSIVGKVVQSDSGAQVSVSQGVPVDSTFIDPADGTFRFDDLPMGNYVLEVEAPDFATHIMPVIVDGGRITYVGEISLSKTPDMVSSYYPKNDAEVVLIKDDHRSNLFISVQFSTEMERESIEEALSISPEVEGTFQWNQYVEWRYEPGRYDWEATEKSPEPAGAYTPESAQITTYSHVHAFTFLFSPKDAFPDTTYHITLSTAAHDTAGTPLERPLAFSFRTIQASYSLSRIQTNPYDGQTDVAPICPNGIQITFPRRMDPDSVEERFTIFPDTDPILIWPEGNQLTIWTGGLLMADTTYTIRISGEAQDLDGEPLGEDFEFSFATQPVQVNYTTPRNGELFVDPQPEIELGFNTYMSKASVEDAFQIEPGVSGRFEFVQREEYYRGKRRWVIEKDKIKFVPSEKLSPNTKYTITLDETAVDSYGSRLTPYTFSFITRPE